MEQLRTLHADQQEMNQEKLAKIIKKTGTTVGFHCKETHQIIQGVISCSMTGGNARVRIGTLENPKIVTVHYDELIFDYDGTDEGVENL